MMNRIVLILSITIIVTIILFTNIAKCKILYVYGYWGTPTEKIIAAPGVEPIPFTVVIVNPSPIFMKEVKVELILPTYIKFFDKEQTYTLPGLKSGSNTTLIFYLSISPYAKQGMYDIKVRITYYPCQYVNNVLKCSLWREEEIHTIKIPIIGQVNISIYDVMWGYPNYPMIQYVSPGVENIPLTIYLLNTGTITLTNVSITLILKYPLYLKVENRLVHNITKRIGALPISKPIPITFRVNIYDNVSEGFYTGTIIVQYFKSGTVKLNFTYYIPSSKIDIYWSGWGSLEHPLKVGASYENIPYTIYLVNTGKTYIYNIKVILHTKYPICTKGPIIKNIGVLPPGKPIPIIFTLNTCLNASSGTYELPIEIKIGNISISKFVKIEISKSCPDIKYVMFYPSKLYQGFSNVLINTTLINLCEVIAKNVIITLKLPKEIKLVYKNSSIVRIENLPPGKSIPIIYLIEIPENIPPGKYYMTFYINWSNGFKVKKFEIEVYEKAKFELVKYEVKNFYPGSTKAMLILYLKKLNDVEVKNVEVYLQTPNELIRFYVPTERVIELMQIPRKYIGDIKSSDIIPIAYTLEIDSDIPSGEYTFTLLIKWYQDNLPIPFTQSIRFSITVERTLIQEIQINIPLIISITIVVIAIGLIIGFRKRIRR